MLAKIIILLIYSNILFGEDFYISEIYANAPGASRDAGKEWLEITNLLPRRIKVNHIQLSWRDKNNNIATNLEKNFEPALDFDDYLVIAQNLNLGLDICLAPELLIIDFPNFKLDNHDLREICVSLNYGPKHCSFFQKGLDFLDGVARYRTAFYANLWFHEPCRFHDAIFASPGTEAEACRLDSAWPDLLMTSCNEKNLELLSSVSEETLAANHSPFGLITQLLTGNDNNFLRFSFQDNDQSDLWLMRLCGCVHEGCDVCHEIITKADIMPNQTEELILEHKPQNFPYGYLEIEDLAGQKLRSHVMTFWEKRQKPTFPCSLSHEASELYLLCSFTSDMTPLNIFFSGQNNQLLYSRGQLSAGQEKILVKQELFSHKRILVELLGKNFQENKLFSF
jgi:hypothetical protein